MATFSRSARPLAPVGTHPKPHDHRERWSHREIPTHNSDKSMPTVITLGLPPSTDCLVALESWSRPQIQALHRSEARRRVGACGAAPWPRAGHRRPPGSPPSTACIWHEVTTCADRGPGTILKPFVSFLSERPVE